MKFDLIVKDYRPWFDLYQVIFADGELLLGTAERFAQFAADNRLIPGAHVYLNTPGGSLDEGLRLGRKIRELGFDTNVGRHASGRTESGICASAGVFAYLGGTFRYMLKGSKLGVHQFYASQYPNPPSFYLGLGQTKTAEILEFIRECKADPRLLNLIMSAYPGKMYYIKEDELRELRVTTDGIFLEEWELEVVAGIPYLRGHAVEARGEHKLAFMSAPTGALLATAYFGTGHKQQVVQVATSVGLFIDDDLVTIPDELVIVRPSVLNAYVTWMFEVPWRVAERMLEARKIGSAAQPPNRDVYMGFHIGVGSGKRRIAQLLDACRVAKGEQPWAIELIGEPSVQACLPSG